MDRLIDDAGPSQAANELAVAAALGGLGDLNEEQANGALENEDDSLSLKLLNNAAALHLRGGEKEESLNLMNEAVKVWSLTWPQKLLDCEVRIKIAMRLSIILGCTA